MQLCTIKGIVETNLEIGLGCGIGAGGGSRTPTGVATRQILSLVRLPIPPLRRRAGILLWSRPSVEILPRLACIIR